MMQCKHKNVLRLIGFSTHEGNHLIVSTLMSGGALSDVLKNGAVIPWDKRIQIVGDVTRGMAYLHGRTPPIVHRDLKTCNVLLDVHGRAVVADFGLSRLFDIDETDATHVSTRLIGTYGYMAPEYMSTGHLTPKADIYAFGVIMLEVLTGLPVVDSTRGAEQISLVLWLQEYIDTCNIEELMAVAPQQQDWPVSVLTSYIALMGRCLQQLPANRPEFSEASQELNLIWANGQFQEMTQVVDIEDERKLCLICLNAVRDQKLEPCNHIVACQTCAPMLRECPVCRTVPTGIQHNIFDGNTYHFSMEPLELNSSSKENLGNT
mmetsp:Transcript_2081/g.6200  ORF Transcript_2081/g.6200 Transcript_2081/m.6200 type:complete len:320 (+) Transcript_2081:58-1017(+)